MGFHGGFTPGPHWWGGCDPLGCSSPTDEHSNRDDTVKSHTVSHCPWRASTMRPFVECTNTAGFLYFKLTSDGALPIAEDLGRPQSRPASRRFPSTTQHKPASCNANQSINQSITCSGVTRKYKNIIPIYDIIVAKMANSTTGTE